MEVDRLAAEERESLLKSPLFASYLRRAQKAIKKKSNRAKLETQAWNYFKTDYRRVLRRMAPDVAPGREKKAQRSS